MTPARCCSKLQGGGPPERCGRSIGLPPAPQGCLVIGYGNDLRGDDQVGRCAAEAIDSWGLPGVQVRSLHQLVPELAAELAQAELAIFLDAAAAGNQVVLQRVLPAAGQALAGHAAGPSGLLALTHALYAHAPEAWLITIPAESFAFGAGLSLRAAHGLEAALQQTRSLIYTYYARAVDHATHP